MYLVDEEEVALLQRREDGRHVPRPLEGGPARRPQPHAHLLGQDAAEARLPEARRASEQDVVEGLAAPLGGLDEDPEVLLDRLLTHELVERARPELRLVVADEGLRSERMLLRWAVAGPTGRPGYVFRHAFLGAAAHGEVVHLFHA